MVVISFQMQNPVGNDDGVLFHLTYNNFLLYIQYKFPNSYLYFLKMRAESVFLK